MKIEKLKRKIAKKRYLLDLLRRILGMMTLKEKLEVELRIRMVCKEEGLTEKQADLAVAIARAESNLNPKASNVVGNYPAGSIDRGIFMWNSFWHSEIPDTCAYNVECATRHFIKALRAGHLDWWRSSRKRWGKYI